MYDNDIHVVEPILIGSKYADMISASILHIGCHSNCCRGELCNNIEHRRVLQLEPVLRVCRSNSMRGAVGYPINAILSMPPCWTFALWELLGPAATPEQLALACLHVYNTAAGTHTRYAQFTQAYSDLLSLQCTKKYTGYSHRDGKCEYENMSVETAISIVPEPRIVTTRYEFGI
jgi:hypothetical protein